MRIHKWSAIISLLILILCCILTPYFQDGIMQNIFIGVISSTLLLLVTSTISYKIEKRRILYIIYKNIYTFIDLYGVENLTLKNFINALDYRKELRNTMRWFVENIYKNITEVDFFFKKGKTAKIVSHLQETLKVFYDSINTDINMLDQFVLGNISEDIIKSHKFFATKKESLNELQKLSDNLDKLREKMNFYSKPEKRVV